MTAKEAIEQMRFDIDMIIFDPSTGEVLTEEDVRLRNEDNYRMLQASKVAIDALELTDPKTPNLEGDGYDNKGNLIYDTWICPNCEKHYEMEYEEHDHCPNCGQAINWKEFKNEKSRDV